VTPSPREGVLRRLSHDLRHAWRMLGRMPMLAVVVVLSLGVGIGMNVAVYSWISAVVLRPLPGVRDASSFLLVMPRTEMGTYPGSSWLEYQDLRERLTSVRDLIASRREPLQVGPLGESERLGGLLVSGNYFSGLGLTPAVGRFLVPDEVATAGGAPVVIVSWDYWQSHLDGVESVIGSSLRVNDVDLTIIGVTPRGFRGTTIGLVTDLWLPATLAPMMRPGSTELERRAARGYTLLGRPVAGAALAQVQDELTRAMERLALEQPATNATIEGEVQEFGRAPSGPQRTFTTSLWVLQGVMLLFLVAVCGNTANLMLARASARQREIGMRLALGAGRSRVATLLLAENLLLGVLGAVLGAGIAYWGTALLRPRIVVGGFPISFHAEVDMVGLGLAMLLGIGCGLVFGLPSALQLSRVDPQEALRVGAQGASRNRLRNVLMATEVALAMVVLIATGILVSNFSRALGRDTGFQREGVLLVAYGLAGVPGEPDFLRAFSDRLLDRVAGVPGVEAVGIGSSVPLDIHGMGLGEFELEGRARGDDGRDLALVSIVTPGYFEVLGLELRGGTGFAPLLDRAAPEQVIVNEEFVRRYIGEGEPVGRRLISGGQVFQIVGVVADALYEAFDEPPKAITYFSYRDRPRGGGEMFIRTRLGGEPALAAAVLRAVRELDPALPLYDARSMTEHLERNLFMQRLPAQIFAVLGPLLLLLASIGIFAVVSYSVARRTHELGIRLALGATGPRVAALVVGETMVVVAIGALAGWVLAFEVVRLMPATALDPVIFVGVPTLLLGVAGLASWLPARRAARLDPVAALRQE